jgi:hypothetical protein
MKSPAHAHAAAIASAVVAVAVASGFWLLRVNQGGVEDLSEGWLPAAILLLAAAWLVIRALLEHRIQWRVITVIIVAAAFALWPVILYCGPTACFTPGPNGLIGWFIVGGVAFAALVHHLVLTGMSQVRHG